MENMMYLLDLERTIQSGQTWFWKSGRRGYTTNLVEAGIYSFQAASEIVKNDIDETTIMISLTQVRKAMKL
jgi:hypothetical protein